MIQLDSVSKFYGDVAALDGITLSVERGERKVLLGTSGCGKSTILRLIIGLIKPDRGSVTIAGDQINNAAEWEAIRQRMGYVIQDGGLFPHLTARGNVSLVANHLGWEPDRTEARLHELVKLTQLPESSLDRYPTEISGGQRQRVSLIRALMLDPDIMLMDDRSRRGLWITRRWPTRWRRTNCRGRPGCAGARAERRPGAAALQ